MIAGPEKRERIMHMLDHVAQNNVIKRRKFATGGIERLPDAYAFLLSQFPRSGIGLDAKHRPACAPRNL